MSNITPIRDYSHHAVLDLFAGVGFGVALQRLGVKEYGVDNAKAVIATRAANGLETVYEDVWDLEKARSLVFDTLVGGPPCPTFSSAGKGSGRKQMPLVLQAITDGIWRDIDELHAWSDTLEDLRTGLVLTPLAYIHEFRPDYVMLEQVKEVLPVWEAYRVPLDEMGYSVAAEVLDSERWGVPQTRRRAILIARKRELGEVRMPAATHSRYYTRDRERLDPGVLPWVSMHSALSAALLRGDAETWMPVMGFEGFYEVSDMGRVRSVDRVTNDGRHVKGVLRKPKPSGKTGHLWLPLWRDGASKGVTIHRLVLEAFIGSCPKGMEGCHNDGDPSNNRLDNLRWDTRSENTRDAIRHGNHFNASKEVCPRGHLLTAPNLVANTSHGQRNCLACDRGRSHATRHGMSLEEASDLKYAQIMPSSEQLADESTQPDSHGRRRDDGRVRPIRDGRPEGDSDFTLVSNYTDGTTRERGRRMSTEPAFTITAKADRMKKEAA